MLAIRSGSRARSIFGNSSRMSLCGALCMIAFGGAAQVLSAPATTTSLAITSGGNRVTTVVSGSVVALTATVVAGSATIGQVNFCDATATFCSGTHLIGTAQLTSGGAATFKFVPPVGSHSYQAVFVGTGSNAGSASTASSLVVTPAAGKQSATTTLAESGSAGNVTLTATVAGSVTGSGSTAPTGSVSFVDTSNANTVLGTALLGPGTFGQNVTVSQTSAVGLHPRTVLVTDVNADGIPDIISGGDGVVSVLIGNGDGTFQTANNITALSANPWITTTSFRNGGPVDILTVSDSASNVNNAAIIFGNGTGGVSSVNPFSLPFGSASAVTSADFNGDGQQDFAVVFKLDNKISTYLGEGVGQFQAPTTLATGSAPVAAVVGNFNGHGKIDIAVANSGDNTISIYLGSTNGAESTNPFTVVTPVQANFSLTSLAVGDFNGDGIDDLAATGADSQGNAVVAIYFGKGAGAFTLPTIIPELLAPSGIVAADVLGNGKLDIVVTKAAGNGLDLFLNDGAGNFSQGVIPPSTGSSPMFLAKGHFNGQATEGLAVANNGDGTVSVFLPQLTQSASTSISGVSSASLESLRASSGSAGLDGAADNIVAQYSGDANFATSTSTPIVVAVNNPVPTIATLSPTGVAAGSASFTLTVNGTGFVNGATVSFGGANKTTSFSSATQVTAQILATDVATAGTPAVVVTNPTPGGGASNSVNFNVTSTTNPVPTLTSLSPTTVTAGVPAFSMTVTGTNFVSTSTVDWNGAPQPTTFVSATQLMANIAAADVQFAGSANVIVVNPAPGGGTSNTILFVIATPVPALTTLVPNTAIAGDAAFTLTVNGSNFESNAVVQWNGANLATSFGNSTQLTANVPAADIATAGTASVVVFNPNTAGQPNARTQGAPVGTFSNPLTFTITAANPVPTITTLFPTSVSAGSGAFTLTVNGTNYISSSVVQWNGSPRTTTFVSATKLTAVITAADIQTANSDLVTVVNPTPGGGTSNVLQFNVTTPIPALTSLAPNSAIAGGAAFTLTLNGSNFITTSMAQWNGTTRTTTFVSSTQLMASISAADIATAGTASVTVFTPTVVFSGPNRAQPQLAPSGTTSNALTFSINAPNPVPTLTSISPATIGAGGASFTLTLTGTNFVATSAANFKGSPRTTTFLSATQLTAAITAADIAASGTAAITVVTPTPGGGTAAAVNLTITDFSVTSPNPTQTVTAGQTANFTITTAPVGGAFTGNVTFTTSALPTGAAASFNPTSVASGSSTTMSITTTARGTSLVNRPPFNPNGSSRPWRLIAFLFALTSLTIAKFGRRNVKRLIPIGAFALLLISAGYLSGCVGGFPKVGANTGTPAGTYPVTVMGISGTVQHTTTVTLVVQ